MVTGREMTSSKGVLVLATLLALLPVGSAMAQDITVMGPGGEALPATRPIVPTPIACPATPAALPGELSGWNRRVPLTAGRNASTAARLDAGAAVDGTLSAAPEVHYVLRPEKPGGSLSFGGIYAFTVTEAGHYRVALGSAAWIDVIKTSDTTKGLTSIAHSRGPDCSGIRKMVDFALEPGDYVLQVSASAEAKLPLLVTRLP